MTEYFVRWEIEVYASSPQAAAEQALEIQRDKGSLATVFDVVETADGGCGKIYRIDINQRTKADT